MSWDPLANMQHITEQSKKKIWEFRLGGIEDLKQLAAQLNVPLDAIENISILAEPVRADGSLIPNSLAIHPMEGCDGDHQGRPGKLTFRRYERYAHGGAGLIWAEAIAVAPEARANPRQLWLNENSKQSFAALLKQVKQSAASSGFNHRPVVVAQLTHSGRYSNPHGVRHPLIPQRDPYRDAMTLQEKPDPNAKSKLPRDWPVLTDEYLDELVDAYVKAAKMAFEVGFDAVDIKSCHGYLINELLACHNRRGKYGGSFENRTGFLLQVIEKIHKQVGQDKPVVTRLGIYDAIPYPFGWGVDKEDYTKPDLTEPKKLIARLAERGVKMINVTGANPYFNPHYGRPFNEPIAGGYPSPEHPLVGVSRLITLAGEIQAQFRDLAIIGTGYSWLRTLMPNVAAATKANGLATVVGVGRLAFAYPDFARDILLQGRLDPDKACVGCSACTQIMRDGGMTGCVVRDNKIYGPIYERGRMSDRDNLVRLASACRQCQEPTCQSACPAGIDIPKFIDLFLKSRDRDAYQLIRQANIFPEVCAWLCPVEQQCEGNCLQKFIGDGPVPIASIQRYLAEQANKKGWAKLPIPKEGTGKKVAVIGAGPAGLACAAKLLEAGHSVTIFDKIKGLGGMVESVIPPDRQGRSLKNEIAAIFKDIPEGRMILQLGKELDTDFNLDSIVSKGYDAVFIGMGLPQAAGSSEERLEGLYDAIDFLSAAKDEAKLDMARKRVAVIGGGNTAMDAAITAKQSGARDVYLVYRRSFAEMPAWPAERDRALNEGVHFLILTQQLGYVSESGRLKGIRLCPTILGPPDASGRRRPQPAESSEYKLDMDIVVEAMGQQAGADIDKVLPGVEFDKGLIRTIGGSFKTSRPKVFAGGDLVRGASTVVAAVADGMKAAKEIDRELLREKECRIPKNESD